MSESELIGRTTTPATTATLLRDLRAMGITRGDVLVVHSSLRSLGWVAGGAAAVVDALLEAVGPEGTVSMPSQSGDWSDPERWANPPVPEQWWAEILQGRPAYDPYATPLRQMGAVAENFLVRRSTLRSAHPLHSQMANGMHAAWIIERHPLDDSFGDGSPLGRLYELDAKVLLIGVGHDSNTSLHLAEARARWKGKTAIEHRSKVEVDGAPTVVTWSEPEIHADDFERLGDELDASGLVQMGRLALATCRLARQRAIVDASIPWFEANRG